MRLNPFLSLLNTLNNALTGRLHFPRERIGEVIAMEDGQEFIIFRQVIVDPSQDEPEEPGATSRVRFHVAHMPARQNKLFSLLPIPFFAGLPGLRSKLWMLNEASGDFQGIYEWDSVEHAKNYADSFAMKFTTMRSARGSISYEIVPKQPN
ncbi:MAG: YdhR family protein [Candidatus Bathyarchaeota archaeon]|nr:YdhR family protein [Candidatus Bathyarchaeota archaeon]